MAAQPVDGPARARRQGPPSMPTLLGGRLVSKAHAVTDLTPGLGLRALENQRWGQEGAERHRMDGNEDCDMVRDM